jgi:hypothetical protein
MYVKNDHLRTAAGPVLLAALLGLVVLSSFVIAGEREPGQIHVGYPSVALDAEPGQFVLAANAQMLERALENGRNTGFIYYGATVEAVGELESTLRNLAGRSFSVPNAMILPIEGGHQAQVGDVLLGRWESGSGLRRSIVIGGEPDQPLVRYLDRAFERDQADGQREDHLRTGRFMALTDAWQLGSSIACRNRNQHAYGILVHDAGDEILGLFHAGRLESQSRAECTGIPPRQNFEVGDTVHVPGPSGNFLAGTVTEVDAEFGRVWVSYSFANREREMAFSVVDVATGLNP